MFRGVVAGFLLLLSFETAADVLIKTGCSKDYPGVQWFIYEDEEGNRYSTKDGKSRKCGFSRTLNLLMEKEYGDRFNPAIIKVDYKDMLGREEAWGMIHSATTLGSAERIDKDTIAIYGDGRVGDGIFTLGVEEIQFRIEEEPVCEVDSQVDCEGHVQRTNQDLIYYGEEYDTLVTWELGILVYASHKEYGIDVPIEILDEYDVDSYTWDKWERRVEKYNNVYELSGVHVQYKLAKVYLAHWHSTNQIKSLALGLPVDIVLGYGTSYPDTCGVAKVTTYFAEGKPTASMSRCDIYTDLHEMGHSVGLAHGPENQDWQQTGYIFPEYGHGWNNICSTKDDLMSYGWEGEFHSNSKLDCSEIFGPNSRYLGTTAGGVQWSDTAKALNRIRYNVSLIHDENKYVSKDARLKPVMSRAQRIETEIID